MDVTLQKFGYPASMIKEYKSWQLLCRPKQVTLGSLILISKEPVTAFSHLSSASFIELGGIIKEVEHVLKELFNYEKINYLMLMMVDPEVHFHIFPRYSSTKSFSGRNFIDKGWPLAPDLNVSNELEDTTFAALSNHLKSAFSNL